MSGTRETGPTSKRVGAVVFAFVMLFSAVGMAFVGGAGAQNTGGTFDNAINDFENVGNDLNIDETGDVRLIGPGGINSGDVVVEDDGRINISDVNNIGSTEFGGVAISAERIANLDGTSFNEDAQATFLDEKIVQLQVNINGTGAGGGTDDANFTDNGIGPAIFIELDPQSEFSQITGPNANVTGEDDFIVILKEGSGVSAFAVDNTNIGTDITRLVNNETNYDDAIGDLVGGQDEESDLQDKNVDNVLIAAGTGLNSVHSGGQSQGTIDEIQLTTPNNDFTASNETIHSEKITLNPGSDEQFFSSIQAANDDASNDNNAVISVDRGDYSALEGTLTLDTANMTVETNSRTNAGSTDISNRFNVDFAGSSVSLDDRANEAIVSTNVSITNNGITIDGFAVDNDSDPAINISADTAELAEVVVLSNASGGQTAVNVQDNSGRSTTINNSAILEDGDPVAFDNAAETGLNLSSTSSDRSATVSGTFFVGFEQQIAGLQNIDTPSLVNNNPFFSDDRTQLAVVEDASGAVQDVDTLVGNITAADGQASDSDVIAVAPGTYNTTFSPEPVDIDTDNLVLDGRDNGVSQPQIDDEVNLSESNNATVNNVVVDNATGIVNDGAGGDLVTIRDVTLSADNTTIDIQTGDSVTVDTVDFTGDIDSTSNVVNITATDPDVTVSDVAIEDLDPGVQSGVNITDAGSVVSVTNTTVDFDGTSGSPTAINVSNISTASDSGLSAEVNIADNTLLNVFDGIGIDLDEDAGGEGGRVIIDGNEIRGSTNLIGINYDLPASVGSDITANTIIGTDVSGGASSVGVRLEAVTTTGDGVVARGDATTLTFTDNVLSGHARVIEAQDDEFVAGDYDAIVGQTLVDDENLNNTLGTVVVGPDGTTVGGANYTETYGSIDDGPSNPVSYLPGSVEQAAKLVNNTDSGGTDDTENVSVSTLEVQDPTITGVDSPDRYDENGTAVNFPDMESLTITGAGDAQAPLIEDSQILIDDDDTDTGAINNHSVSDLALTNTSSSSAALNVTNGDNSQTTFANLNVTADGTGLNVSADGSDVNVIEVRDSTFDVGTDGIVLAASGDDRDGFVIDNVALTGPGIDQAGTGLDLSNVDKPGKEDPALETELTVQDVTIDDFERQLELSTNLTSNLGIDVEDVLNGNVVDNGTTNVTIDISEGDLSHAVTVFDQSGTVQNEEVIFGSIDEADAAASGSTLLDVRGTGTVSDGIYGEDVSLVDGPSSVTVEGPQAGNAASASLRGDEAIIDGDVNLSAANDTTVDGLTIRGSSGGTAFTVDNDSNVNINNTAITTQQSSSSEATGVSISNNSQLLVTLTGAFVGDHDAGGPVSTGVVVNGNQAELTVESDSTLADGTQVGVDVQLAANAVSVGSGDVITIAGVVREFNVGVDVANDTTVSISGTVSDNAGDGVRVTNSGDVTVDGATISSNTEDGIDYDNDNSAVLAVTNTDINQNDDGILLGQADGASSITQTTFDNNNAGLVVESDAPAGNLEVKNNAFTNNADVDIRNKGSSDLDATLNFFGTQLGPEANASANAGVESTGTGEVVYDPFLTEDQTSNVVGPTIAQTTAFGHDVIIPADETVSIGFPAEPDADADTVGEAFADDTLVFKFEGGQFTTADDSDEINAFDAFVVQATGSSDTASVIEYQGTRGPSDTVQNVKEFNAGLNFVAPQAAGTVNEALFPGGDTDLVTQAFADGGNRFGDVNAAQSRDAFVDPSAAGFSDNFRGGAGDRVVHPHTGYFVIVNEGSNEGLAVAERIPTPDEPTAQNIDERTDTTAGTITNVQTGDTFTSLATALEEVQDGQTLELGVGTFSDGFEQVVSNDDVTLRGAGTAFTIIDDDLTVQNNTASVRLRGLDVAGTFTDNGTDTVTKAPVIALSNLDIANSGASATIDNGTNSSVSVDVNNIGGVLESTSFNTTLEIDNSSGTNNVTRNSTLNTADLDANGTQTVVFENVTGDLGVDDFDVTVSTNITGDPLSGDLTVASSPDTDADSGVLTTTVVPGETGLNDFTFEVDASSFSDNSDIQQIRVDFGTVNGTDVNKANDFSSFDDGQVDANNSNDFGGSSPGDRSNTGSLQFDVDNTFDLLGEDGDITVTVNDVDVPDDGTGNATVSFLDDSSNARASASDNYTIGPTADTLNASFEGGQATTNTSDLNVSEYTLRDDGSDATFRQINVTIANSSASPNVNFNQSNASAANISSLSIDNTDVNTSVNSVDTENSNQTLIIEFSSDQTVTSDGAGIELLTQNSVLNVTDGENGKDDVILVLEDASGNEVGATSATDPEALDFDTT